MDSVVSFFSRLRPFPGKVRDPEAKLKWKRLINRQIDKSKLRNPGSNQECAQIILKKE